MVFQQPVATLCYLFTNTLNIKYQGKRIRHYMLLASALLPLDNYKVIWSKVLLVGPSPHPRMTFIWAKMNEFLIDYEQQHTLAMCQNMQRSQLPEEQTCQYWLSQFVYNGLNRQLQWGFFHKPWINNEKEVFLPRRARHVWLFLVLNSCLDTGSEYWVRGASFFPIS